jgi:putative ABC transport system substrate-binding protein
MRHAWLFSLFLLACGWASASDAPDLPQIAVLYPDTAEPARIIFTNVIGGIETQDKNQVLALALKPDSKPDELASHLRVQGIKVVIGLGGQGVKQMQELGAGFKTVGGAVLTAPDSAEQQARIITMTPEPALLFAQLKKLRPDSKRVWVVYSQHSAWLMARARQAANAAGLELVAQEASDSVRALALYQTVLAQADPKSDALWLPQDRTTADEGVVLPMLLKQGEQKPLPIFSSSPIHVKKGVLFALMPDYAAYGSRLGELARHVLAGTGDSIPGVEPLIDCQIAINLRAAKQLGLVLSRNQVREYHYVYPEPEAEQALKTASAE